MPYGLYIHVPFCSSRCGYCDFNTYTPQELAAGSAESAGAAQGNTISGYLDALEREIDYAAEVWDREGAGAGENTRGVDTVFFGGGTPSMLGHEGLNRALNAVKRTVGLSPDAEVTTESNPESTSPEFFENLRAGGFTRVSLGMQSAAGHVLKVLERQHTPGRPVAAVREARAAGFEHVNLDLIYGTPTETDADVQRSLDAVMEAGVDHVSAYSLIVEDGTAMARKVRRGQLPAPDEDVLADRYSMIDAYLRERGYQWYEVSNWALPGGECKHNLIYWHSGQWWGAGPGAHGCVRLRNDVPGVPAAEDPDGFSGLTRLVNAKRPATYWEGLLGQGSASKPITGSEARVPGSVVTVERLTNEDVRTERIMLGLRLAEGLDLSALISGGSDAGAADDESADAARRRLAEVVDKYERLNLVKQSGSADAWRVVLTDEGRYLADGIVTDLVLALD